MPKGLEEQIVAAFTAQEAGGDLALDKHIRWRWSQKSCEAPKARSCKVGARGVPRPARVRYGY
jgi:hypothetical protein